LVKSILMVCRGNICRSPMAEGYFRHQLQQHSSNIVVSSAGISALVNYPADTKAQEVMKKNHIDLVEHRATQLTNDLVRKADLIFVMTKSQLHTVIRDYVTAKGKTFLLGHWQDFEILDPYTLPYEEFESAYQQVEMAWEDWKSRILSCQTCV
jgi:protein-tyrosine phosphatase